MYRDEIAQTLESLKDMPRKIQWILDTQTKTVQEAAKQMVDAKSFLFLGRHVGYPVAMEGALKLKEIAYTFTEGFAAGELKHGPIALVDEGEPVVFIVPPARGRNVLHAKVISGIEEVRPAAPTSSPWPRRTIRMWSVTPTWCSGVPPARR